MTFEELYIELMKVAASGYTYSHQKAHEACMKHAEEVANRGESHVRAKAAAVLHTIDRRNSETISDSIGQAID